jgi:hypothetical protein
LRIGFVNAEPVFNNMLNPPSASSYFCAVLCQKSFIIIGLGQYDGMLYSMTTTEGTPTSPADSFMEDLAERVARKVVAELRLAPVVKPLVANVKDAAGYLRRTEDGIRGLVASGILPNSSPDARVQIPMSAIEAFAAGDMRPARATLHTTADKREQSRFGKRGKRNQP